MSSDVKKCLVQCPFQFLFSHPTLLLLTNQVQGCLSNQMKVSVPVPSPEMVQSNSRALRSRTRTWSLINILTRPQGGQRGVQTKPSRSPWQAKSIKQVAEVAEFVVLHLPHCVDHPGPVVVLQARTFLLHSTHRCWHTDSESNWCCGTERFWHVRAVYGSLTKSIGSLQQSR